MAKDKAKISRRAAIGAIAGGIYGFLRVDTERDSLDEIIEKVAVPVAGCAVVGAATAIGDKAQDAVVKPPSEEFLKQETQYRDAVKRETINDLAEKRSKEQHDGGGHDR
jgi:hypothetical protein